MSDAVGQGIPEQPSAGGQISCSGEVGWVSSGEHCAIPVPVSFQAFFFLPESPES